MLYLLLDSINSHEVPQNGLQQNATYHSNRGSYPANLNGDFFSQSVSGQKSTNFSNVSSSYSSPSSNSQESAGAFYGSSIQPHTFTETSQQNIHQSGPMHISAPNPNLSVGTSQPSNVNQFGGYNHGTSTPANALPTFNNSLSNFAGKNPSSNFQSIAASHEKSMTPPPPLNTHGISDNLDWFLCNLRSFFNFL